MDWSKLLKKILKTDKELTTLQQYAINAPNPAATKGQPGYIASQVDHYHALLQQQMATKGEVFVTMPKSHGKTSAMYESIKAMIIAYDLDAADILSAGHDAKIHKVGEANDLTATFEAKLTEGAFKQLMQSVGPVDGKSWIYGAMGGRGKTEITAPESKPQLQPIFERLSELAEEMPPESYRSSAYADMFLTSAKPSFTFNGVDFPGEDVESFEQAVTKEGITEYKIKLTPQAYDKWTKAYPFKVEAP